MKPLLVLAALAAAAILLRRINPAKPYKPDADDSEVVGMPTWDGQLLQALGLDPGNYTVEWREDRAPFQAIDWDDWFETARRQN